MTVLLSKHAPFLLAGTMLCASVPAQAELPAPVRAMVDAAMESGKPETMAAVIEMAKLTNPDDVGELDALQARFDEQQQLAKAEEEAAKEAEILNAGLLEHWSGNGEIGAFVTTGNNNNAGLAIGLNLQRDGIDWQHKLRVSADFQRSNGATTRERYLAAYEPRYNLSDRLFLFGLGQWEQDRFQGYSSRISTSGGVGYRVIDRKGLTLSLKAGPAWRRIDYINEPKEEHLAVLSAADLRWQIARNLVLTEQVDAYVDGSTNITARTGFEAAISDGLKARLAYLVEYDSEPADGSVKTDTLTRLTLVYGF